MNRFRQAKSVKLVTADSSPYKYYAAEAKQINSFSFRQLFCGLAILLVTLLHLFLFPTNLTHFRHKSTGRSRFLYSDVFSDSTGMGRLHRAIKFLVLVFFFSNRFFYIYFIPFLFPPFCLFAILISPLILLLPLLSFLIFLLFILRLHLLSFYYIPFFFSSFIFSSFIFIFRLCYSSLLPYSIFTFHSYSSSLF